jgi:hypothetical protein
MDRKGSVGGMFAVAARGDLGNLVPIWDLLMVPNAHVFYWNCESTIDRDLRHDPTLSQIDQIMQLYERAAVGLHTV